MEITALAADPAFAGAYWAVGKTTSDLHGIDANGDTHAKLLLSRVGGLATHKGHVYCTLHELAGAKLFEWTLPGGVLLAQLDVVLGAAGVGEVATGDGENVVWGVQHGDTTWHVNWTQLSQMVAAGPYAIDPGPVFASDGISAYWPSSGNRFDTLILKSGGITPPVMSKSAFAFTPQDYVAADGAIAPAGYLYITSGMSLLRFNKDSALQNDPDSKMNTVLAQPPKGLVVSPDGNVVYWLEDSSAGDPNGRLMRSDGWTSAATVWVDGIKHPSHLALDSDYLYYSAEVNDQDDHLQVYRVER
jgi:hypothetical protein